MRECFREFYNASLLVGQTLLLLFVGYDVLFFPVECRVDKKRKFPRVWGVGGCVLRMTVSRETRTVEEEESRVDKLA